MPASADQLSSITAIEQLKYRYVRFLDQKRWDEMGALFHPEATAAYSGGKYSFEGRDEIVGFMERNMSREGFHTSHRMHHPEISFTDPDHATGIWAMDDVNVDTEFGFYLTGAGFYDDRYVRDGDTWLIAHTGYRRTFETIQPLAEANITVTASWWATDGRSDLDVQ